MSYARFLADGDAIFETLGDTPDDLVEWELVSVWQQDVRGYLQDIGPMIRIAFDHHAPAHPLYDASYTPQRRFLWQSLNNLHAIAGY